MRMSIAQLDELVKLLELFEKDETVRKLNESNGKIMDSINTIKEIAINIIV